ncbi:MAG: hypothetical protein R6V19_16650, partial [Armatimonadota bacterium]
MRRTQAMVLVLLILSACTVSQAVVEPNTAFWAEEMEYEPGEMLMLRPRLPAVDLEGVETYELRVEVPAALASRSLDLHDLDRQGLFLERPKSSSEQVQGDRRIFTFTPEIRKYMGMKVEPGRTYTFSCMAKGENIEGHAFQLSGFFRDENMRAIRKYPAWIMFDEGTYDWKRFEVELTAPENATALVLVAVKWGIADTWGRLYLDDMKLVSDAEPDKNLLLIDHMNEAEGMCAWPGAGELRTEVVPKPGDPDNRALPLTVPEEKAGGKVTWWLPLPVETTTANFDDPWMLPTISLHVPDDFTGTDRVNWAVLTDGTEALSGSSALVPAPDTPKPREIEISMWLAESFFALLDEDIQAMYLQRLKRIGLNTIYPALRLPEHQKPFEEFDFTNFAAQWAQDNGMEARSYMYFLYGRQAKAYCKAHPEYWASTWAGNKTTDYRVCLTHALDGDKYDENRSGVGGGFENPWLGRLLDGVSQAVQLNGLDGVWWDFEIRAAPKVRARDISETPKGHGQVCMDERCLRAFADYADLDEIPTVKAIVEGHELYEKWVDFKCWQHTRAWKLTKQAAQRANPEADFRIYSGLRNDYTRQAYGVEWSMAPQVVDTVMGVHWAKNDAGVAESYRKATRAGGNELPVVMNVTVSGYAMNSMAVAWRQRHWLTNQLLQTVIDWDAVGFSLVGIWAFDSQFNATVRKAAALLAEYEELLTTGTHDDSLL